VNVPVLSAVIFDVDGTLADTERDGHRPAFNEAFAIHGLDISWNAEEYGRLLKITGGRRRIAADLRERGFGDAADDLAADIHQTKTALFRERILADQDFSGAAIVRAGFDGIEPLVAASCRRVHRQWWTVNKPAASN
jgi:beta-phosphoglucomutase-like phosphatase (HAD superfamily)